MPGLFEVVYMDKFPYSAQQPYEVVTFTLSSLQMRKKRLREKVDRPKHMVSK